MALIRLSKGIREYILKQERPGEIDKDIAEAEKQEAESDADKAFKDANLSRLRQVKDTLSKYGPTVWMIESISKAEVHRTLKKSDYKIRFESDDLTTGQVASVTLRSYDIVAKGLRGWKNLRGADGKEVEYKHEYIEDLEEAIIHELANEISGNVTPEEAKNSDSPPSS